MGKHLKNILFFIAIFLLLNVLINSIWGQPKENTVKKFNDLSVNVTETEYRRNSTVTVELKNYTNETLEFKNDCPGEPFKVIKYTNGEWVQIEANPQIECTDEATFKLEPNEELKIPYTDWHYQLFSGLGRFKIQVPTTINGEEKVYDTQEFTVIEESLFGMVWMRLFYQPVYNTLVYFISIMPGFNLGLAIILLTLVIRTLLLVPSQKALRSQRRMQSIQPRIEEIKKKHAGDQQKIAAETMALWKTQKVSPFGSCLPLLIQFPILIALFYAVKSGLNPDNAFLLYEPIKDFNFSAINANFFGLLDLTKINLYVLPIIIGGLQFIQMKLSMSFKDTKKEEKGKKNEMQMATSTMVYFMPVMIAVFTASLPAAVGLYWGTSTFYGIIQQLFVNREKIGGASNKNSSEVKIKVIDKN